MSRFIQLTSVTMTEAKELKEVIRYIDAAAIITFHRSTLDIGEGRMIAITEIMAARDGVVIPMTVRETTGVVESKIAAGLPKPTMVVTMTRTQLSELIGKGKAPNA